MYVDSLKCVLLDGSFKKKKKHTQIKKMYMHNETHRLSRRLWWAEVALERGVERAPRHERASLSARAHWLQLVHDSSSPSRLGGLSSRPTSILRPSQILTINYKVINFFKKLFYSVNRFYVHIYKTREKTTNSGRRQPFDYIIRSKKRERKKIRNPTISIRKTSTTIRFRNQYSH
jgi:hypothetical protein